MLDDDTHGNAVKYLLRMVSNEVAGIGRGKSLEVPLTAVDVSTMQKYGEHDSQLFNERLP